MPTSADLSGNLEQENARLKQRIAELEANAADQSRTTAALHESEARFRDFFDNAPIGKSMMSSDGRLLRVNHCLGTMLGYSAEELRNAAAIAITHPDDVAETVECVSTLFAGKRDIWDTKKRYIAKDGHIVWAHVITRLQHGADEDSNFLLTHALDITEQKQIEQRLAEQQTLLHNLIESAGNPIFSVDHEYRYTTFNMQHASVMKLLYGVEIEHGETLLEYQRATGDDVQTKRNLDRALAGEVFTDEGFSGDDALTRSYFEVSHHPITNHQNQTVGVAVFARDTTGRRRAEEELRRVNVELDRRVIERTAQLEESNRELEAFSYSVSHDLRAPLRAIDGYTHILTEEYGANLDSEGQRLCNVIRENTTKMGRLIDELLGFSRQSRAAMNPTHVDMRAKAQSVYLELTTPEVRNRIDFQVSDLPPAFADPSLMRQVWTNLISNAIKFTAKRERANITVLAQQSEQDVTFSVTDNGAGFDMQYKDKLFGVFQRLHNHREFDGNGVGLALVQRIIRRHKGRVWAEGTVDQGATFYFLLPKQQGLL